MKGKALEGKWASRQEVEADRRYPKAAEHRIANPRVRKEAAASPE
jgi:hypothetical protein